MDEEKNLFILGEDILDPYGGAFKANKDLSTNYPDRVLSTPISEGGIIGFGAGMALNGKKIIIEIMFGDFLSLGFDQIINNISKFRWLYDGIKVPLIIRTPMGGYRGYGATHSQSIEKHFCGIPSLNVISLDRYTDIEKIFREALNSNTPSLIIENKILYSREQKKNSDLPYYEIPDIICVSYGGVLDLCVESSKEIFDEEEVNVSVYNINNLNPFEKDKIRKLSKFSKKFLIVEEACGDWGFSEMCLSALIGINNIQTAVIKGPNHPIPSSKYWEEEVLPNKKKIKKCIMDLYKS